LDPDSIQVLDAIRNALPHPPTDDEDSVVWMGEDIVPLAFAKAKAKGKAKAKPKAGGRMRHPAAGLVAVPQAAPKAAPKAKAKAKAAPKAKAKAKAKAMAAPMPMASESDVEVPAAAPKAKAKAAPKAKAEPKAAPKASAEPKAAPKAKAEAKAAPKASPKKKAEPKAAPQAEAQAEAPQAEAPVAEPVDDDTSSALPFDGSTTVFCSKCKCVCEPSKVRLQGKSKFTFKCNKCFVSVSQLHKGGIGFKAFDKVPQDLLDDFFRKARELGGQETVELANHFFSDFERKEEFYQYGGRYLPLGVWEKKGFDVANIERLTPESDRMEDAILGTTFRVKIYERGDRGAKGRSRKEGLSSSHKPVVSEPSSAVPEPGLAQPDDHSKKKRSRSASSSSTSSSSRGSSESSHTKRKRQKKEKKKRKEKKRQRRERTGVVNIPAMLNLDQLKERLEHEKAQQKLLMKNAAENSKLARAVLAKADPLRQALAAHMNSDLLPLHAKNTVAAASKPLNEACACADAVVTDSSKKMNVTSVADMTPFISEAKKADAIARQIIGLVSRC
jgi:hypothetical protein